MKESKLADELNRQNLKQKLKENLISYWNEHHSLFDSANIGDYYVAKTIAETILSIFSDQPIYKPLNQEIGDAVEYLTQYIHSGYHQSDIDNQNMNGLSESGTDSSSESEVTRRMPHGEKVKRVFYESAPKYSLEKPTKALQTILKESIIEEQLPFTLLIENIPETISEDIIRVDIIRSLKNQHQSTPIEIGRIPYFTDKMIYRVIFLSVEECNRLVGKTIVLKKISEEPHVLYKPPLFIPTPASNTYESLRNTRTKHKRFEVEVKPSRKKDSGHKKETGKQKRKRKTHLNEPSVDVGMDIESSEASLSLPTPPESNTLTGASEQVTTPNQIQNDDFVIDSIAKRRDVSGKSQYLFKFRGETQEIKAWLLDEQLLKQIDTSSYTELPPPTVVHGVDVSNFPPIDSILGAIRVKNQLMLSVKWKDMAIESLIPSSIVKEIAPQKIIEFYESHLIFSTDDGKQKIERESLT